MAVTSLKAHREHRPGTAHRVPWPATLAHYGEVLFSSSGRRGSTRVLEQRHRLRRDGRRVSSRAPWRPTHSPDAVSRRDLIFVVLVGSLMIPNAVVLVPRYVLTQRLGWLRPTGPHRPGSGRDLRLWGLPPPAVLPDEPGRARGCRADRWGGPLAHFSRIVLPLSQPVLAALAIFAFRSAWNDFLWPLIAVNKAEVFPLPVACRSSAAPMRRADGPIMAGRRSRAAAPRGVPRRQPPRRRGCPGRRA